MPLNKVGAVVGMDIRTCRGRDVRTQDVRSQPVVFHSRHCAQGNVEAGCFSLICPRYLILPVEGSSADLPFPSKTFRADDPSQPPSPPPRDVMMLTIDGPSPKLYGCLVLYTSMEGRAQARPGSLYDERDERLCSPLAQAT